MAEAKPPADCVFCGIVARRIPSYIVYEDAECLAFLDLFPWTRGHLLVVPKGHVDRLKDLDPTLHSALLGAVAELCRRVERLAPDCNVALNQGAGAGQIVFHLHVHIIPRYGGDQPFAAPHRPRLVESDALELVRTLASAKSP